MAQESPFFKLPQFEELITATISGFFITILYLPIFWLSLGKYTCPGYTFDGEPLGLYIACYGKLFTWKSIIPFVIISPVIGLLFKPIFVLKPLYSLNKEPPWIVKRLTECFRRSYRLRIQRDDQDKLAKSEGLERPSFGHLGLPVHALYRAWLYEKADIDNYWRWEHFLCWTYDRLCQIFVLSFLLWFIPLFYWLVSHSGRIEGFNLLQWVIIELIHLFLISLLSATRSIQNMVFNQTDQVFFCDFFADQENRIKTLISDSDFNEVKKVCDGIKREEYLYSGRRF